MRYVTIKTTTTSKNIKKIYKNVVFCGLNDKSTTRIPIQNIKSPILEYFQVCPENFTFLYENCVYVSSIKVTWLEAKANCEALDSRLLVPNNDFKFRNILIEIGNQTKKDFWVKIKI